MKITKHATNHGDDRERAEAAERERDKARAVAERLLEQRDAATAEALKLRRRFETAVKVGSDCIADFVNLQAEADKLAERRDRWRKRAEAAGELAAEMRSQRDAAREEVAQARRKALTEAAETVAADAYKWAAPSHRAVMLETAGKLRAWAEAEAPKWQGPIEVQDPTPGVEPNTAERIERVFKACGYKPMETDSVEILRAILRTAEGIRADLRAREERR